MKKICFLALFLMVAVEMLATAAYVGDLNNDGEVDSADVSALLEQVLNGGASYKSDINGDGFVDSADVSALLELVLNGGAKKIGETFIINGIELTMINVPGGTFTMGGTSEQGSDARSDESPTHVVTLSPYMIGQTEVTQELWEAVMGENPSINIGDNLPVARVNWYDCQEFIDALNELTGMSFRLPTEAEWEYAARGGQSGGTKYAGSDDIGEVAWYERNAFYSTQVGTKRPNDLRLYDMSGNVWEWCEDMYDEYSSEATLDPVCSNSSTGSRVYRGGGFESADASCRVSRRGNNTPYLSTDDIGLRLVLGYDTDTYTVNGVSFNMVYVPGGTFEMGGTAEQGSDARSSEFPTHMVSLSSYMIGQTEVTQELWKAVMGSNPSHFQGDKLPVETVSWNDCQTFITRLNTLTGKSFRLPTEAEWEYAARGAQSGGTKYAGSDNADDVAWHNGNASHQTNQVATKQPNALGLFDMSGNVDEWCQDWDGEYEASAQINPVGPSSGEFRTFRGGCWHYAASYCRVSQRGANLPSNSYSGVGLRLALDNTETYTVNGVAFKMVNVPGGTFTMGGTAEQGSDAWDDEKPTHSVKLSSYMIGQTEVTQALWVAVMGYNPSPTSSRGDDLPVQSVNWNECQEFITKLNRLTGETFRLPTEAEWEYAARGGKSGGTKYAGSDSASDVAWYLNNSDGATHSVATKAANGFGAYDMSGNVFEWCYDWYDSYSASAQTNPQGPSSGTARVVRGGSWGYDARKCRVSYRQSCAPSVSYTYLGLRLAR